MYVHIPFCEKKCIYCNFYSVEQTDGRKEFLQNLLREIALRAADLRIADQAGVPQSYDTLFFGGGTPSLLSPDELGSIVGALRAHFTLRPDAEVTVECNPGTLHAEWLHGYRAIGVNRLSFGVQSFHDDELRFLSRIHTADQARAGIAAARQVFDNVSLDLIFALPGQTAERWRQNLEEGLGLGTTHISAYSLIFEEGTPLNAMKLRGEVRPAEDALDADMYSQTIQTVQARGFTQYEVSNYARPGYACRHNLNYWQRGSYIAFGPSSHSLLRGAPGKPDTRWANVSSLSAYNQMVTENSLPVASREMLSSQVVFEEIVMLGLRSTGIDPEQFRAVAGVDPAQAAPQVVGQMLQGEYAMIDDTGILALTPKGYGFADHFALQIITAAEKSLPHLAATAFDVAHGMASGRQLVAIDL